MVAGVLLVGLVGCADRSEDPKGLIALEGSPATFDVERSGSGRCEFDYRAQLSLLRLATGEPQSVVEIPWPGESEMVLAGDRVVVRSADYPNDPPSLIAVAASDGMPTWQREVAGSFGAVGAPLVAGDVVVTLDGSSVLGLRVDDGEERWRRPAGDEPLIVVDGSDVAIAKPRGGEIELLDAASGVPRWSVVTGLDVGGSAGVALTPSTAVTGGQADALAGLDRASGRRRWEVPAEEGRYRYGLAAMGGERVILFDVASNDPQDLPDDTASYLWSIDARSGSTRWRVPVDTNGIDLTRALGDLVIAPRSGSIEAIDVETGNVRWTFRAAHVNQVSRPTPDLVVITTSRYGSGTSEVHAIDADSGEPRFTATLPVSTTGPATAVEGLLLIGGGIGDTSELVDSDHDGFVFALSVDDGTELWRTERRDAVMAPIRVRGDAAIVLSADRSIFCD